MSCLLGFPLWGKNFSSILFFLWLRQRRTHCSKDRSVCIQLPQTPQLIQTRAIISENSQLWSLGAGRMHRLVITTSWFFFFVSAWIPDYPVQEAILSSLAAILSREPKISLAGKDPGSLINFCKYSINQLVWIFLFLRMYWHPVCLCMVVSISLWSGYHLKNEVTVITIPLMSTATWGNCSYVISQQRSGHFQQLLSH